MNNAEEIQTKKNEPDELCEVVEKAEIMTTD